MIISVTSPGRPFFVKIPGFERLFVLSRVAITLWCLATPCEYLTVAHIFAVAHFTICEVVQETCQAIVSNSMHLYIRFLTGDDLKAVVE